MFLTIDLGKFCNFTCRHCITRSGPNHRDTGLNDTDFGRIKHLLSNGQVTRLSFVGGEPTLYTNSINKILNYSSAPQKIFVQLVTNGWFANSMDSIKTTLGEISQLDSLVVSLDKFHEKTWDNLGERLSLLKAYCGKRVAFTVEIVVSTITDIIAVTQKINDPSIRVNVQFVGKVGRALDNNFDSSPKMNENELFNQRCPQLGAITYHHTKGFSFCCGNLAFNNSVDPKYIFFSSTEELSKSEVFNLLKENTFGQIKNLLAFNNCISKTSHRSSCDLCESLFRGFA